MPFEVPRVQVGQMNSIRDSLAARGLPGGPLVRRGRSFFFFCGVEWRLQRATSCALFALPPREETVVMITSYPTFISPPCSLCTRGFLSSNGSVFLGERYVVFSRHTGLILGFLGSSRCYFAIGDEETTCLCLLQERCSVGAQSCGGPGTRNVQP